MNLWHLLDDGVHMLWIRQLGIDRHQILVLLGQTFDLDLVLLNGRTEFVVTRAHDNHNNDDDKCDKCDDTQYDDTFPPFGGLWLGVPISILTRIAVPVSVLIASACARARAGAIAIAIAAIPGIDTTVPSSCHGCCHAATVAATVTTVTIMATTANAALVLCTPDHRRSKWRLRDARVYSINVGMSR